MSYSNVTLEELLEHVKAGDSVDQNLDRWVFYKLLLDPELDKGGNAFLKTPGFGYGPATFTSSLNAAQWLCTQRGWRIHGLDASILGRWRWTLTNGAEYVTDHAKTGPRGLVATLIGAVIKYGF